MKVLILLFVYLNYLDLYSTKLTAEITKLGNYEQNPLMNLALLNGVFPQWKLSCVAIACISLFVVYYSRRTPDKTRKAIYKLVWTSNTLLVIICLIHIYNFHVLGMI